MWLFDTKQSLVLAWQLYRPFESFEVLFEEIGKLPIQVINYCLSHYTIHKWQFAMQNFNSNVTSVMADFQPMHISRSMSVALINQSQEACHIIQGLFFTDCFKTPFWNTPFYLWLGSKLIQNPPHNWGISLRLSMHPPRPPCDRGLCSPFFWSSNLCPTHLLPPDVQRCTL